MPKVQLFNTQTEQSDIKNVLMPQKKHKYVSTKTLWRLKQNSFMF